jgi:formylglycine-generating enzyme required for sulfatase activity
LREQLSRRVLVVCLAGATLAGCGQSGSGPSPADVPSAPPAAQPADATPAIDTAANDAQAERRRLEIAAASQPQQWEPKLVPAAAETVGDLLQRADDALAAGRVEGDDSALDLYLSVLEHEPGNARAQEGVRHIAALVARRGEAALDAGQLDVAARVLPVLQRLLPSDDPHVAAFAARLQQARELALLLVEAERLAANGTLVDPPAENAAAVYREVLERAPGHAEAQQALSRIEIDFVARANAAAEAGNYGESDRLLALAARVQPGSGTVQNASTRIVEMRQDRASELLDEAYAAAAEGDLAQARTLLAQLESVSVQAQGIEELRQRIANAGIYGNFHPGQSVTDPLDHGGNAPELVVIRAGEFEMGSPRGEDDRKKNEGPQHRVELAHGFAMARAEITVAQFRAFVDATDYVAGALQAGRSTIYDERTGSMAERAGIGWEHDHGGKRAAGNLPVVHVSWNDAKAYADWLSRETGERFRLPSEAEFEYVLRAGGSTRYPWGEDVPARVVANLTGDKDRSATSRSWSNAFPGYDDGHWGPAPVRSYEPNAFGVHDIDGNVSEWVEDCWHDGFQRAPADGSPWVNPGCNRRVLRGGSWASSPDQARSAFRLSAEPGATNARLGFRVVRELVASGRRRD